MVVLIAGASHTGKTLLAQRLMEKLKFPYICLDHIKMGLVRGMPECGFSPTDDDEIITDKIWGMVKGIIDTCRENKQNIILEGCYFPFDKVSGLICDEIVFVCLIFSENYINNNFDKIIGYENEIEKRLYSGDILKRECIDGNNKNKFLCNKYGLEFFEIDTDYNSEIKKVYRYISERVK